METLTRLFVWLGYAAVAINASIQLRRRASGKAPLIAMIPAAVFWTLFYGHVTFGHTQSPEALVQWSRLGHTLVIGGLLYLQYFAARCHRRDLTTVVKALERELP